MDVTPQPWYDQGYGAAQDIEVSKFTAIDITAGPTSSAVYCRVSSACDDFTVYTDYNVTGCTRGKEL